MNWHKDTIHLNAHGKGLYPFTDEVNRRLQQWEIRDGMCYLFIQHTSASLVISESYDPSARQDMEMFMEKLVPDDQAWHRHTLEGADDTTSHMRSMLTNTSLAIPVDAGRLCLGTWQGIYLFEHRRQPQQRHILVRCLSID